MKITEALLGEHGVLYAQFDHLEQGVLAAETPAQVHAQAALLRAAIESHAGLEDELLFIALEPYLGTQTGPLAVMRMEHDEIERILARVLDSRGLTEARNLLLRVVQLAREHFAKEEQVLYPMAEQVLNEDTLTQQGRLWAERRHVSLS